MHAYLMMTPAYQEWCRLMPPDQCDVLGYTSYLARVDHMIAYIGIMCPDFVEKDGLVLRSTQIPDDWASFIQEAQSAGWTKRDIEYIINHVHIADIFLNDSDRDRISNEVYVFIANTIAGCWRVRLQETFPDKKFDVRVTDLDTSPEVYACQVLEE